MEQTMIDIVEPGIDEIDDSELVGFDQFLSSLPENCDHGIPLLVNCQECQDAADELTYPQQFF